MNVTLSPWSASDADALAAAVGESPELAVQLGEAVETPSTARGYIEQYLTDDDGTVAFAIRVDGVAVGHGPSRCREPPAEGSHQRSYISPP